MLLKGSFFISGVFTFSTLILLDFCWSFTDFYTIFSSEKGAFIQIKFKIQHWNIIDWKLPFISILTISISILESQLKFKLQTVFHICIESKTIAEHLISIHWLHLQIKILYFIQWTQNRSLEYACCVVLFLHSALSVLCYCSRRRYRFIRL